MSQSTVQLSPEMLLEGRSISKSFGGIKVLHGIDIELRAGEVHALLGENGAGKSTLCKILCGFERPDAGELISAGSALCSRDWDPRKAERRGIVMIHQEFNLAEQLSIAENIFLGRELRRGPFLDYRTMTREAGAYLRSLNCELDPGTRVSELSVADRQMVEIARTRVGNVRVLVLDEPTAVLTGAESEVLYELIRKLAREGVAVVFISHKLDEIQRLADRVSILRDGNLVGNFAIGDLNREDMVRHMVGRDIDSLFPPVRPLPDDFVKVLEVRELQVRDAPEAVGFDLRQGEVLGFFGLVGSGRSSLLETVTGLRKPPVGSRGRITLNGREVDIPDPRSARDLGISYLTKDRAGRGLLLDQNLRMNFSLYALSRFAGALIRAKEEASAFKQAIDEFEIRCPSLEISVGKLSGGNQQKLLLAKFLAAEPRVLIVDEPTRGIDIGTRSQIYLLLDSLVQSGTTIILISSDITEIIGMCHRVAVMYRGSLAGTLDREEFSEREIMRYATGLKSRSGNSQMKQ